MRGRLAAGWGEACLSSDHGSVAGLRAARLDGECEQPGRDPLSGPADDHPDELVLGRPGHRRAGVPLYAPRLQRTVPGRWRSSPQYNQASRQLPGHAAALHAQRGRQWSAGAPARACRTPSSSTPPTGTSTSRWRPSGSTRSPPTAASERRRDVAQERLLHRRLLHLRHTVVGTRGVRRHEGQLRRPDDAARDLRRRRPTSTTTAIRARRSRSTGVPDGTYWFRAITDPNNDFVEANEANNETDVKVTIAGGTVTAGQVVTRTRRRRDHVGRAGRRHDASHGTVTLSASARQPAPAASSSWSTATSSAIGTTASPYTLSWDSTTVVDGEHWLAARTTDAQGRTNTADSVALNVANARPPPPPVPATELDRRPSSVDGSGTVTTAGHRAAQTGDLLLAFVASDGPRGQTATVSRRRPDLVARAPREHAAGSLRDLEGGRRPARCRRRRHAPRRRSRLSTSRCTVVASRAPAASARRAGPARASGAPTRDADHDRRGLVGVRRRQRLGPRAGRARSAPARRWATSGSTPAGDTFWMQSQTSATAGRRHRRWRSTTPRPTTDQWNLAAVEVLSGSPVARRRPTDAAAGHASPIRGRDDGQRHRRRSPPPRPTTSA